SRASRSAALLDLYDRLMLSNRDKVGAKLPLGASIFGNRCRNATDWSVELTLYKSCSNSRRSLRALLPLASEHLAMWPQGHIGPEECGRINCRTLLLLAKRSASLLSTTRRPFGERAGFRMPGTTRL